jgi:UDP-N-acetylglucosamine acyltransferase
MSHQSGIHPLALVDPAASLHPSVVIGPYSIIGPKVSIGADTVIGPHCVIDGKTTIGERNRIYQFSSLGAPPQDKKYQGEDTQLIIGNDNTIREFCTFNTGTVQDAGVTRIGDQNWIMAYVHLAHDCQVGSHTIFANNTQLAGHVHVGDWAILGGFTVVHQFCRIGAHAFTAMNALLFADLPPFVMCQGQPAAARSMNYEGLRRRGFSTERLQVVKAMYKLIYRDNLTLLQAMDRIRGMVSEWPSAKDDLELMLQFLGQANEQRGIVR